MTFYLLTAQVLSFWCFFSSNWRTVKCNWYVSRCFALYL